MAGESDLPPLDPNLFDMDDFMDDLDVPLHQVVERLKQESVDANITVSTPVATPVSSRINLLNYQTPVNSPSTSEMDGWSTPTHSKFSQSSKSASSKSTCITNPFDDSLKVTMSPSIFNTPASETPASPVFSWHVEHRSQIMPAEIDENFSYESPVTPRRNSKVQASLRQYWDRDFILPSPNLHKRKAEKTESETELEKNSCKKKAP